jgi:hypothetical protein
MAEAGLIRSTLDAEKKEARRKLLAFLLASLASCYGEAQRHFWCLPCAIATSRRRSATGTGARSFRRSNSSLMATPFESWSRQPVLDAETGSFDYVVLLDALPLSWRIHVKLVP